ncbi:MAG: hypothetical protein WKF59_19970 [Chitinophagaceae bacterium]
MTALYFGDTQAMDIATKTTPAAIAVAGRFYWNRMPTSICIGAV